MPSTDLSLVNDLLTSKYRLAILALLAGNDAYDFNALKRELGLTDGNLSSHMTKLESGGLIRINRGFNGKKTRTLYTITQEGRKAWDDYLNFLTALVKEKTP